MGGGRSASHVPYPDLAGRHRGQAAIGATGVTGAALNSLFYRSRVQPLAVTADASWLHRVCWAILHAGGHAYRMHAASWIAGCPRADAAVRAEVTAVTRPPPSGGTRHTTAFLHARQAPRWLRGGRGAVSSTMEPEPEDEEQQAAAAAAAATEAPDESTVAAARVSIAGHEIAVDSTALDVSGWGLPAAQVWEVAGALPLLLCLRELVLDAGVPASAVRLGESRFSAGVSMQ
eukprot:COSAG01_NODE_2684_length_7258_cov_33.765791_1_plen_232_part_00